MAGLTVAGIVLAVILFLGPVAERIPFAVLAAILMVTAWNFIDWEIYQANTSNLQKLCPSHAPDLRASSVRGTSPPP